MKQIY